MKIGNSGKKRIRKYIMDIKSSEIYYYYPTPIPHTLKLLRTFVYIYYIIYIYTLRDKVIINKASHAGARR